MDVLERPGASFHSSALPRIETQSATRSIALAVSFTSAAALAGLFELLIDRIAAPAMTGALGRSAAGVTTLLASAGRLGVSVTAVLVLLALLAWAAAHRHRHPVFALAAIGVVIATVVAGLFSDGSLVIAQAAVVLAVTATLAMRESRPPLPYTGALWAIALAIVAGQWSLWGLEGGSSLVARAVAEAAFVLALVLFGVAAFSSSQRALRSVLGFTAGAGLGAVSLAYEFTPFVALLATGAMMWLPSLMYIIAAGAVGSVLAAWLSDPTKRHRTAGLVLLAVAGIGPALVHHSAAAVLALVALSPSPARERGLSWR